MPTKFLDTMRHIDTRRGLFLLVVTMLEAKYNDVQQKQLMCLQANKQAYLLDIRYFPYDAQENTTEK